MSEAEAAGAKLVVVKGLQVLKFFYTFKELERLLGVPAQVLWRYASLRSVPERRTAERIAERMRSLRLIDRALEAALEASSEPWEFVSSIGVLEAAALKLSAELTARGLRPDTVVPAPDPYSAAWAATVAAEARLRLCLSAGDRCPSEGVVAGCSASQGRLVAAALPRRCIRGRRLLLLAAVADQAAFDALASAARRANARVEARAALLSMGGVDAGVIVVAAWRPRSG